MYMYVLFIFMRKHIQTTFAEGFLQNIIYAHPFVLSGQGGCKYKGENLLTMPYFGRIACLLKFCSPEFL